MGWDVEGSEESRLFKNARDIVVEGRDLLSALDAIAHTNDERNRERVT